MATRMQQRRGTAAQWLAAAPVVLAAGEIGFETDTNQFKMGDGTTEWQVLSYFKNLEDLGGSLDDYIPLTQKGIAGGVPTLDSSGLIPLAQLPGAAALDAEVTSAVTAATTALTTSINTADAKIDTKHGVAMAAIATATSAEITRANAAYDINGAAANALTSAQAFATTAAGAAEASALADANDYTNTEILAAISTEETNRNTAIGTSVSAAIATEVTNRNTAIDSAVDAEAVLRDAAIATQSGLDRTYTNTAVSTLGTTVDSNLTTHIADTTNIHGIADTSVLATATTVATAKSEAITAAGTAADTKVSDAVAALTKSSVGLGNVDNTADTAKPVSTAQATAIATAKSEAIADATAQVNAVIASAPAALNTLDELAAALGDDANFASTVTTSLATKAPLASPTFTGTVTVAAAGIVFSDGTQAKAGVPSITTFGSSFAASATLAAGEQDKFVPVAGAVTITLPATGYSTGQSIDFYQASGTGASFASTNSVVGTPGLKFRTTNSVVTAMKTSSGWLVFGDLSA
jgi:inorganic triphosphatase YgiF